MLNKEQAFFLEVLQNCVNDTDIQAIPEGLDWESLLKIAKVQEMKAILCEKTAGLLMGDENQKKVGENLFVAYAGAMKVHQNRLNILQKIQKEFTEAEIPFFVFKGTEISSVYPKPFLRTMGDSDILVHEDDRERAHEILLKLGMQNRSKNENEWVYYLNGMEFELHCRLMNDWEVGNDSSHKAFMNRRWDYAEKESDSYRYHLDWNYHFVFILLHLRKHFINSGIGFRMFADLVMIMQKCELDWNWIEKEIEQLGLTRFSKTCFAFCQKWFGVSFPFDLPELEESFYEDSTDKIFHNGVFGFNDANNKDNYTILQLNKAEKQGKLSLLVKMLFPPYDSMIQSPKFSFLKGKRWLLPVGWIYRFLYSIFRGTASRRTKDINRKMSISDQKLAERKEYLDNWGL